MSIKYPSINGVWRYKNGRTVPLNSLRYLAIDEKIKLYEKAVDTMRGKYPSINNEDIVKMVMTILENDTDFLDNWGTPL